MLSSLEMEEPAIGKLVSYLGNIKKQLNQVDSAELPNRLYDDRFSNNILSQLVRFSNKAKSVANVSKGITIYSSSKEIESFFDGKSDINIRDFKLCLFPNKHSG